MPRHEQAKWRIATTIKEYANETDYKNNIVSNSFVMENNALTKNGSKAILELLSGIKTDSFNKDRTYIGISSSTISSDPRNQTTLDNEIGRQPILSAYPKIQENYVYNTNGDTFDVALLYSTTFYSDKANGVWNSFGIIRRVNTEDTLLNCRNLGDNIFTKSIGSIVNITIAISIQ